MPLVLADHRDRVIEQLSSGFAHDHLEVEELERRIALAHAAETTAALDSLVTDLVPARGTALVPAAATTALVPATRLRVVMGSIERFGAWTVPAHLAARVVCGNLELDLRDAQLAPGVTTIDVHVTLGNVEVTVPPGVTVEVDASARFGHVEDRTEPSPAGARVVRVVGRVTFGNLEVTTLLRGETKRQGRRRRRWERRMRRRHAHAWWA